MGNLFAADPTPKEMMEETLKTIRKSMRELDRETAGMDREEQKLRVEVKAHAKKGETDMVHIKAKNMVRVRTAKKKFALAKGKLQDLSVSIKTMSSTTVMMDAMKNTARAMYRMNAQINAQAMQRIMRQYAKESDMMEFKQEMMDETIDGIMEEDGDEATQEELVNQILDEIGVDATGKMIKPPTYIPAVPSLDLRLNNLREGSK